MESSTFDCSYAHQEIPQAFSARISRNDLRSEPRFQTWPMRPGKQSRMVYQTLLGLNIN